MSTPWQTMGAILSVAAIYFLTGKSGLSLAILHPGDLASERHRLDGSSSLGQSPLARRFLGALAVNITTQGSLLTTLAIACGNTLEPLLGCWLINRFAPAREFLNGPETPSDSSCSPRS